MGAINPGAGLQPFGFWVASIPGSAPGWYRTRPWRFGVDGQRIRRRTL